MRSTTSGRITIEIDPSLKTAWNAQLDVDHITEKAWLTEKIKEYLRNSQRLPLFDEVDFAPAPAPARPAPLPGLTLPARASSAKATRLRSPRKKRVRKVR
jgi:hypothetical protein